MQVHSINNPSCGFTFTGDDAATKGSDDSEALKSMKSRPPLWIGLLAMVPVGVMLFILGTKFKEMQDS